MQERDSNTMLESNLHVKDFEIREPLWKHLLFQMTEEASEGYQRVDHMIQNTAA